MPFYKNSDKCQLFRDEYLPANAYGPGGSYAVKYENILNPVAVSYGSAEERFEALGDGSFKVTRVGASTAGWGYGIYFNKNYTLQPNHKYYFQIDCYVSRLPSSGVPNLAVEAYYNGQWCTVALPTAANEWQTVHVFHNGWSEWSQSQLRNRILLWQYMTDDRGFQNGDYYMVRRPIFIDLTDAFGSGYEPTTQQELFAALPQLANGGYMPPTKATTLEHTYIPTKGPTAYWIGENCNVHWNMINGNNCGSTTHQGITYTNNQNGSWTINGTSTAYSFKNIKSDLLKWLRNSHKYLIYCKGLKDTYTADGGLGIRMLTSPDSTFSEIMVNTDYYLFTAPDNMESLGTHDILRWCVGNSGYTYDNVTLWPQLFDLTEMFGAGYEPTIDEFKAMYPNDYYPYDESYSPYTSVGNRITAYKGNNYVNFRQLFDITKYGSNSTLNGITYTKGVDGSVTLNGTVTDAVSYWLLQYSSSTAIKAGHKYYFTSFVPNMKIYLRYWYYDGTIVETSDSAIWTATKDGWNNGGVYLRVGPIGQVYDNVKIYPMLFDLTEMFGAGHEPTKEQFDLLFPNTYYPYTASTYIRDVKGYDTQLTLPGGPLYFNQIIPDTTFTDTRQGLTYVRTADGKITITGTPDASNCYKSMGNYPVIKGHKYLLKHGSPYVKQSTDDRIALCLQKTQYMWSETINTSPATITEATETATYTIYVYVRFAQGLAINTTACPYIVDLTAMYGYGNEPTVDEFLAQYPNSYYLYTTSKLIPAQVRKDLYRVNFNQLVNTNSPGDPSTKCGITLTKEWTNNSFICTATGTSTAWSGDPNWYVNCRINQIQGHKYYVRFNGGQLASMYLNSGWTTHAVADSIGAVVTANVTTLTNSGVTVRFQEHTLTEGTVVNETFAIEVIDLTQTFGAGYEPDNVYILNELFGHTFLPYTTSMWVDSPNNIITETPSQITKMLAGYRTVQKQGYEISVDGTYNDPFVCTYYPEQSTQLTSTGANKVDLVNYAGTAGLEVLPDGSFKWTRKSSRFLENFKNPDGSLLTMTAGQTLRVSGHVIESSTSLAQGYAIVSIILYFTDGTYGYLGTIYPYDIGYRQEHSRSVDKDVSRIIMYAENDATVDDYVIFKDFQLEIDTNVGQYEPYTSQLPAPTPTNMLPISYNKSQKIVLDTDATHSTYNFPITSDAKLIWKPSDYSTDLVCSAYQQGIRMNKRIGTDYVQFIPLVTRSSATTDTALGIATASTIQLEANKTYCLVFRFKKVNVTCRQLQAGTTAEYSCNLQDTSGNRTACLESPVMSHNIMNVPNNADNCYDEGWSWARYIPPVTGNYYIRIGTDTPNPWKVFEDKGCYIQFTDLALYEGDLGSSATAVSNLQAVLSDGNKQTIVSNKELGIANRSSWYVDSLEPYVKDTNNEWKSKLNQNTGLIVYKGDENWELSSGKTHTFKCGSHSFITDGGFCTHFPLMTSPSDIDVRTSVYLLWSSPVIITKMDCDSVADFKAFLAAEYNKGTPVTILTGRGTNKLTTYNNPLLAHTLPYHTDINTDAEYVTAYIKESL